MISHRYGTFMRNQDCQTASLVLFLALRRFSTLRPPGELILDRNPWVFFRFRFFG